MTAVLTPAEALAKLLANQRAQQQRDPLAPRGLSIYNADDYAPLAQPGAVTAFVALAATLEPVERAQFAFSLSKRVNKDAAIQRTLGLTFGEVVERQPWMGAYMLLNAVHLHIAPHQPMHAVVVEQLKKLEARSEPQSRESITHMLKTMPGTLK